MAFKEGLKRFGLLRQKTNCLFLSFEKRKKNVSCQKERKEKFQEKNRIVFNPF